MQFSAEVLAELRHILWVFCIMAALKVDEDGLTVSHYHVLCWASELFFAYL